MGQTKTEGPVKVESLDAGACWRVSLDSPKGNVIDRQMIAALTGVFQKAASSPGLKAIVLEGEGDHFSFGASVPEHRAGEVEQMLPAFHGLFRQMFETSVFTMAAIRGQCLGGGLELALFCQRIFAHPAAKLGQPEIQLGVIAPVASILLIERVSRAEAEDLCVTGRVISARQAAKIGLVDELAEDPEVMALEYTREHLLPHSASSLRFAVRAVRRSLAERFDSEIRELETLYLQGLMSTADANEGIQSFLEKRKPQWSDR